MLPGTGAGTVGSWKRPDIGQAVRPVVDDPSPLRHDQLLTTPTAPRPGAEDPRPDGEFAAPKPPLGRTLRSSPPPRRALGPLRRPGRGRASLRHGVACPLMGSGSRACRPRTGNAASSSSTPTGTFPRTMSHDPFDFSGAGGSQVADRRPRRAERLRPGEYSPEFLRDLHSTQAVSAVPSAWNRDLSSMPPGVVWVLHRNGELERIRFG